MAALKEGIDSELELRGIRKKKEEETELAGKDEEERLNGT